MCIDTPGHEGISQAELEAEAENVQSSENYILTAKRNCY
jgi:hypothetical protein